MAVGRKQQDGARARLEARVHEEVATGIRHIAEQRGVSVRTVMRDALYDLVNTELGTALEPLSTPYTRK